jgi:hypothetical protein
MNVPSPLPVEKAKKDHHNGTDLCKVYNVLQLRLKESSWERKTKPHLQSNHRLQSSQFFRHQLGNHRPSRRILRSACRTPELRHFAVRNQHDKRQAYFKVGGEDLEEQAKRKFI